MIADTTAWIEYLRGTGSPVALALRAALAQRRTVMLIAPVWQELLQGARSAAHFRALLNGLRTLPRFVPADAFVHARDAALLYARLRWEGVTLRSSIDCSIALCAIEAGRPLLHADADFDRIARVDRRLKIVAAAN